MTFTFGSDQLVASIMLVFLAGSYFGYWVEKHWIGNDEIEALEIELEALQDEILRAEKDKDHLRELLWAMSQHPAIPHLAKDRQRANAKRIRSVK